ncbi:Subtilin transport ATP-binding protein SpaT [Symbiodinium microadriaticum]|uniref:Subtilin transport ATP-binding protein SpaT n=1 Tax=Symbiodinium microadriaticum TaxID=2951 RepID=A0A1Q9CDS8_SYMMI|nr:Subtilin transport ATP-binding protein SpaT [Symbiodinium microadriaticum]
MQVSIACHAMTSPARAVATTHPPTPLKPSSGPGPKLACGGAMALGLALLRRSISKQRRVPGPRFVATRAWQQPLSGKLPEPLRATDGRKPGAAPEDVFTLDTITQRMPKIIQSTVAAMPSALKTSDFEQNVKALQDEMKEGAQLRLLRGDSPRVGADRWNEHLTEFIDRGEGWHTAPWWVVENYMYKRLLEVPGKLRRAVSDGWNPAMAASMPAKPAKASIADRIFGLFSCTKRALQLVWLTSRPLTFGLAFLTLVMGALPGLRAATTKRVIDAVVSGISSGSHADAVLWLSVEAALVVSLAATRRAQEVAESFLGTLLGHRVNVMILEKALELQLTDFEDSKLYDKLTRARREASRRPLSLAQQSLSLIRNGLALVGYGTLLLRFSPLAVAVLLLTAVPPFIAGVKFAGDAFQLARRQTSGFREQIYLERVMAMDTPAKEVKLFGLGPWLLIFDGFFRDTSSLALKQGGFGFLLELISTGGLYMAFAWVAIAAVRQTISLGDMTMYLLIFKEGQQAFSAILRSIGGMYADNLYLSNLYEFLDYKVQKSEGTQELGPNPGDGVRFEDVWFRYPGATDDTIKGVTFHIPPGTRFALVGNNGAGKTTLIKLLTGLYQPSKGKILLDGLDLNDWAPDALKKRIGAIFQDFIRYELTVGANVGVGDIDAVDEESRVARAAERGMAAPFIEDWPQKYQTQLGNLFMRGRELSGGQWQKVALSRALMRERADLLVLDEPTAAMDAEAEAAIFERLASLSADQSALLISHRFSTVRMADTIAVLNNGVIEEFGSHEDLLALGGTYARLFNLQAKGMLQEMDCCGSEAASYDPFETVKLEAPAPQASSEAPGSKARREALEASLLRSLWGNQADLSLSAGEVTSVSGEQLENLVSDHRSEALDLLLASKKVVVVMDNYGLEVLCDLVLVDAILSLTDAAVSLHVKDAPVFVSDVTDKDVPKVLKWLETRLPELAERLKVHLGTGRLKAEAHSYYTTARSFWEVPAELQSDFSDAAVVLKGDANFRRLLGDLHWPYDTDFAEYAGSFWQGSGLICLRTMKSGVAIGIPDSEQQRAQEARKDDWLTSGVFGQVLTFDRGAA